MRHTVGDIAAYRGSDPQISPSMRGPGPLSNRVLGLHECPVEIHFIPSNGFSTSQAARVLKSISTSAAVRCALRAIVNDSERYVAMSRYIAAQRSRSGNRPLQTTHIQTDRPRYSNICRDRRNRFQRCRPKVPKVRELAVQ